MPCAQPSFPAERLIRLPKSARYLEEARVSNPEKAAVWSQKLEDLLVEPDISRLKVALEFTPSIFKAQKLGRVRGHLFEDFIGLMLAPILQDRSELDRETWRGPSVEADGLSFRFDHVVRSAEAPRDPRVVVECKIWLDANWLLSTLSKFYLLKPGHPKCRFYLVSLAWETADLGRSSRKRNLTTRLLADRGLSGWSNGIYFVDDHDGRQLTEFLDEVQSALRAGTSC